MKLDIKLLVATLIAGVVAAVLDAFLYTILDDTLPGIILIPLMILILAVVVVVTIMVVCELSNNTDDSFLFLDGKGMIIVGVLVSLVLLTALTGLFQWIYERELTKHTGITSYIFILDESGSMESNDPDCERYSAVQALMESMDANFPYAAYAFADECVQIRDMEPVSAGMLQRPATIKSQVGELTFIQKALTYVYDDIQSGALTCVERPQVILLTDGIANDMETFLGAISEGKEIINKYAAAGITISTVGLSGNVDNVLMTKISEQTNGTYVQVDHATDLLQGFSSVAMERNNRDLFSKKNGSENGLVYGLMRVAFLTIIGAVLAFIKAMATGKTDNMGLILIVGSIAALVGALLVEFGTFLGLPALILAAVYLALLAITPVMYEIIYANNVTMNIHDYTDQMYRRR